MLQGLAAVAWRSLGHAYGPADGVPGMLWAAASTDEQHADAAVSELYNSVFHQGTVYPASVAVVPFVAELAATPTVHHRFLLVALLGGMADPRKAHGSEIPAVRAALTAQVPRLLPLLADRDPKVRETAAYTLAQCPDPAGAVVARLRERWAVEDVPLVRASLLGAGGRLDPAGCADWLAAALHDRDPAVRAAAALAIAWAGLPWPGAARGPATGAIVSAYRDGDPLSDWVWHHDDTLAELLTQFDDVRSVPAAVVGALVQATSAEARDQVAYAVEELNLARRSAPAVLVPLLAPLLADPSERVRSAAAGTVGAAGSAGALVADELAVLAAQFLSGQQLDRHGAAAKALCALIELGDRRWRAPLLAAWRSGQAPYDAGSLLSKAGVTADPELVAAVRAWLTSIRGEGRLDNNERARLVWLLGCWGPAAAAAVPELRVALKRGWGTAPRALAAIGPPAMVALPALRATARRGGIEAAAAVWHLAGEPDLLIRAVRRAVDHDQFCYQVIDRLLVLGGHARALLPRLRQLLTGKPAWPFPARDAQMAAARVVWQLTADPDEVLPTVRAVLAAGDRPAGSAAGLGAEFGAHARGLLPLLRAALDDPWARVDAARALWRLDHAAPGLVDGLVEPLLAAVADSWGGTEPAVGLLVEMRAVQAIPRLRELAEQDRRIVTAGAIYGIVRGDERLQARLYDAIADLERDRH
jgi:HEAT repeat protein